MSRSWGAVDTRFLHDRNVRPLSASAKVLWLAGRLHCAEYETDGLIERSAWPLVVFASALTDNEATKQMERLVAIGFWRKSREGWHDLTFLDDNASHEVRENGRKRDQRKNRKRRQKAMTPGDDTGGQHQGLTPGTDTGVDTGDRDSERETVRGSGSESGSEDVPLHSVQGPQSPDPGDGSVDSSVFHGVFDRIGRRGDGMQRVGDVLGGER